MFPEFAERSKLSEALKNSNTDVNSAATPQIPEADAGDMPARLRIALEDNSRLELAIQTVRHSAGNQLALLSAMLARQARTSADPAVRDALTTAQRRVHAVAETLRMHGCSEDGESVDAKLLVERVAATLRELAASAEVKIEVDVEELALPRDEAASFVLIINELMINSLKHGFPNNMAGEIRIRFAQEADAAGHCLALVVEDNGIGRNHDDAENGLGTTVIGAAVKSLGAKLVEDRGGADGERRGLKTTIVKPLPHIADP